MLGQVAKAPWHGAPSAAGDRGLWPIDAFGRRRPWIAAFGCRRRSRDRESMQCRSMNLGIVGTCKAAGGAHAPPVPSVTTNCNQPRDDATHNDLGPKQLSSNDVLPAFFSSMESMCNTSLRSMVLRHKISVLITAFAINTPHIGPHCLDGGKHMFLEGGSQ